MARPLFALGLCLVLAAPVAGAEAPTSETERETSPEPIPLSGRVVDQQGDPRVEVAVRLERTRRWNEVGDEPAVVEATTGSLGVFRARLPEPGFWRVLLVPDEDRPPVTTTLPHQPISRETDLGEVTEGEPATRGLRNPPRPLRVASPEAPRSVDETHILEARVVREEDGRPVPHALVGSSPELWTVADDKGRFRLPVRGTADTDLRVEIEAPGRRRAWVPLLEVEPGGDVTLGPTALVAGHVVDAGGDAVADARVGLAALPGQLRAGVRTGADGAFALETPSARQLLQAVHPDYLPHLLTDLDLPQPGGVLDGLVLTLDRGFPAAGRVVDDTGGAVPGAAVWLFRMEAADGRSGRRLERGPAETTSDDDGRFRFDRLAAALYTVEVTSPDYVPHQSQLELSELSTDLGVLELETAAVLEGMVLDPDFRPVAEARVGWRQRGLPSLYSDRPPTFAPGSRQRRSGQAATSDDDGRFALRGLARDLPVVLEASRDGYLPAETTAHLGPDTETGTREEPFVVVLRPAGELTGQVVDAGGEPIEEVDVSARPLAGTATHPLRDFTDADGRFRLTQVPGGSVEVVATQPGRPAARETVEIVPGEPSDPVQLVLEEGVPFTGRVVDADGEPLARAHIALFDAEVPGGSVIDEATPGTSTGPDGRFALEGVAPGAYRARLHHEAYRIHEVPVSIAPGGGSQEFRLTDLGLYIAGRVIGPDGTPARQTSIFVLSGDGGDGNRGTQTRDDGTFALPGLEPGTVDLYVAGLDGMAGPRTVDLVNGSVDDLVIDLGGPGRVVGRVIGLDDGERRAVRVRIEGPRRISAQIEPDGRFEFDRLAPGEWTVYASQTGGASASQRVTIPDGGGEVRVELDLGVPGLTLAGTVLLDGEPRGGLRVFATRGMLFGGNTQTDFTGAFRIDGLEAGPYTLGIHDSTSGLFHVQEIRLEGDREIWVEIEAVTVEGTVVDPSSGRPLAGVPVRFVPLDVPSPFDRATSFVPASRTDSAGAFRVGPLAAGRYRAVVGAGPDGDVIDLTSGLDVAGVVLAVSTSESPR